MGKPGFVPHSRVNANREDSERPEAHGIAGMIARVEELEAEPTPIFDAMAVGHPIVVFHGRVILLDSELTR